jgi:hypothetical protein
MEHGGMAQHCCEEMRSNVEYACEQHPNRHDCGKCLVDYWPKSKTYGLIVHGVDDVLSVINFCPWCGAKLPRLR